MEGKGEGIVVSAVEEGRLAHVQGNKINDMCHGVCKLFHYYFSWVRRSCQNSYKLACHCLV